MFSTASVLVLNHLLAGASWARQQLRPFVGRRACITLAPITLVLEVSEDGYFRSAEGEAEVQFTLADNTPFLVIQGTEAVVREAHVNGPADFADALGFVLRNLRWDAEEDLSKLVGDIAAHRAIGLLHKLHQWQRQAATHATENVVEYLREEKQLLPRQEEFLSWRNSIARLQADLARLDTRIAKL